MKKKPANFIPNSPLNRAIERKSKIYIFILFYVKIDVLLLGGIDFNIYLLNTTV